MGCIRPIFRHVGTLFVLWLNVSRSMNSRSVSFSASALPLLCLLPRTPPTIGNIVGGVYWKPVYNLLEGAFELLVVNAQHIKAVPGRKTDAKDAEWIADLLQHGLLRGSFIPPRPQRELR